MTVPTNSSDRRRTDPIRDHAYTLPLVRELPTKPPDPLGAHALW